VPEDDGRHDFDFVHGRWHIAHRRLARLFDGCTEWNEFSGTGEAFPILGGLGNIDRLWMPAMPGGAPLEGFTLRLCDPDTWLWSIWCAATSRPGQLDPIGSRRLRGKPRTVLR
jgi:hypothetical protein